MTSPFDFQGLAARAVADNPDAALFDGIERIKDASRRYGRAKARDLHGLSQEWAAAREVVAKHRPHTVEGLLAKLRLVARSMPRGSALNCQYSAVMDAIAWLEPPKPRKARRTSGKTKGGVA